MTALIKLEQNITDTIKESQIKLGFTPNAVTLFYPLDSPKAIKGGEMIKAIDEYKSEILSCKASLAQDGRIAVTVSEESVRAIHEKVEASPFLVEFIGAVKEGCSLERAAEIFRKYNDKAVITAAPDDEFDLLAYFPDGEPDGCRYCLQDDLGGITYHRFTKLDYDALYPEKSGDNTEK